MSDVVEKTFAALPKIFSETLQLGQSSALDKQKLLPGLGPCFQNFVRLLHKCKTKNEESQFCKAQIVDVKEQLDNPDHVKERRNDLLFVCVYCHMLGYDVKFARLSALKALGAAQDPYQRKFGCQAANLLFGREDEESLLAVSSICMNLKSPNLLEVYNVMSLVAHFTQPSIIQVIQPYVQEEAMKHPRPLVRAKGVMCLHQYYLKLPDLFQYETDSFFKLLCDPDPSVMACACQLVYDLVMVDKTKYSALVPVLVNILQQIIDRRLPSFYEYHGIPAPWLQIKILKILALLGAGNQRQSSLMYPVLLLVFERTGLREKMSYAICYECILSSTAIYPNQQLLHTAARVVGNFLRSTDISLKYIGIKALTGLIRVSQEFALQYQMVVVELLDHPDHGIQRKTLTLLYSMTNSVNIQAVCDKLLQHLVSTSDTFYKQELLHKSLELVQKFFKPEVWYANILFKIVYLSSTLYGVNVLNRVISVFKLDTQGITEFSQCMVKKSVEYMFDESSSADIVRLSSSVLGNNSALLKNMPKDKLLLLFTKHLSRNGLDNTTKLWIITAMSKMVVCDVLTADIYTMPIEQLITVEESVIVKQKLQELIRIGQLSKKIIPQKNGKRDFTLSFLDKFVSDNLENGGCPYKPKHMRHKQTEEEHGITELFKGIQEQESSSRGDEVSSCGSTSLPKSESITKLPSAKRVWGKEGRIQDTQDDAVSVEPDGQDVEKQQMINALFGGITTGQIGSVCKPESEPDPFFTDQVSYDIKSHQSTSSADSGGWRQLHKTSADNYSDNHPPMEQLENIISSESTCLTKTQTDQEQLSTGASLYDDFIDDQHCDNKLENTNDQVSDDAY